MVGASLFEIPTNPLLFFVGSVSIVFSIVCSSISLNKTCNFVFSSGSVKSFFYPCKLYYLPGLSQYL